MRELEFHNGEIRDADQDTVDEELAEGPAEYDTRHTPNGDI